MCKIVMGFILGAGTRRKYLSETRSLLVIYRLAKQQSNFSILICKNFSPSNNNKIFRRFSIAFKTVLMNPLIASIRH
jgi:hypothetical protein